MSASTIEGRLLYKVESMRRLFVLGEQFERVLETLPAEMRVSAMEAGSAPVNKTGALTGSPSGNISTETRFDGGFDGGSVVNYFGSWQDPKVFDLFETWREGAKIREKVNSSYFVTYQGTRFQFLPHGARGARGVSFKYILKFHGFTVLFFGRPDSGDIVSVQVDFSYESIRGRSIFEARLEVEDFLLSIGFRWRKISFQRIDFNVTLNESFDVVSAAFREGRVVSRVRNFDMRFDNSSDGLRCNYISGGGNINITLYDKMHELIKKYNDDKYQDLEHLIDYRQELTRVEFRIHSAYFSALDVFSWEDLENLLPSIVEYVTGDWFRILDNKKVRGRENRQVISDFWLKVRSAFFQVFINSNDIKPLVKKKKYTFSRSRLLRQALGCFNKALSMSFRHAKELEGYINDVGYLFNSYKELAFKQYRLKCEEVDVLYRTVRPDLSKRAQTLGRLPFVFVPGT